jgi:hypothetical protein
MNQQEIIIHPEQDELSMSPTELLEKRLNRVNLALSQLQQLHMNTITEMQKDVVFSLHVIEALKGFLPGAVVDDAVAAATAATASVGAYRQQPAATNAGASAQRPAPGKLPITPAGTQANPALPPVRHPGHSSINAAAEAAKNAVETLGENIRTHLQHPAPETPARQPRSLQTLHRPTPKQKHVGEPVSEAASAADYLGHFVGSGSVFAKYFSPEVYILGRGFVKPGYGGFGEYEEDVLRIAPQQLREYDYPSGFYTDEATKLLQFYLGNAKMQVTVSNLPNTEIDVWVSFAPFNDRQHIRSLNPQAMQLVFGTVSAIFNAGERLASQQ